MCARTTTGSGPGDARPAGNPEVKNERLTCSNVRFITIPMARAFSFLEPRPRRGEDARARLLAASLDLFGDKGPKGATVRQIARVAAQNVASIGYYFGSKEKLYEALVEGIAEEVQRRLADVIEEIEHTRTHPEAPSATEALQLLQAFLRAVYLRLLSRNETVPVVNLIVREQLRPTAGFEILYSRLFRRLHEALCFLVGTILGKDPKGRETIIRTHMVMGQVWFFAVTREAILRRLAWKDLEGDQAQFVARLVEEHVRVLLEGLGKRTRSGKSSSVRLARSTARPGGFARRPKS